jgi:hypothetical protein
LWLLTAYIVGKLAPLKGEKSGENGHKLSTDDLIDFIFSKLWKEAGVALNDSVEELKGELRFLEKLGYIDMGDDETIIAKDKLSEIVEDIENDPMRAEIRLWDEYIKRINRVLPRKG